MSLRAQASKRAQVRRNRKAGSKKASLAQKKKGIGLLGFAEIDFKLGVGQSLLDLLQLLTPVCSVVYDFALKKMSWRRKYAGLIEVIRRQDLVARCRALQ